MRNVLSGALILMAVGGVAAVRMERGRATDTARPPQAAERGPASQRDAGAPLLIPVTGVLPEQLRDTFGAARVGHRHGAIDILAPRGTPVVAAADGTVRKLFLSRAGGISLYEFDRAAERSYYYAHLDAYAPGMREGLALRRGDVIGYVGTTGNAPATTPHLHFAVEVLPPTKEWWKGEPIDPYPLLVANAVTKRASALP